MPFPEAEGGFSDDPGCKRRESSMTTIQQFYVVGCGSVCGKPLHEEGEVGAIKQTIDASKKISGVILADIREKYAPKGVKTGASIMGPKHE